MKIYRRMFFSTKSKRIFLDYASTTPISKEVMSEMKRVEEKWANPSALYGEALEAKTELDTARAKIASVLNCQKNDIVFTSGGTEGNNLALLGLFESYKTNYTTKTDLPRRNLGSLSKTHVVTTVIEHSSILEVCREIERRGGEVTYVPVGEDGIVSPKAIAGALKENTILVSVMYANNEIGTIQLIKEIGRVIKEYKTKNNRDDLYFHTDACQAPLYLDLNVQKLGVDMMTLDGIKMYGPRGAGILYAKSNIEISPTNIGGGQENGRRSGTENVGSSVGLACALEIAHQMREKESERLVEIRDYAIQKILKTFPSASLNGSETERLPNNINICFPGLDAEFAVISLDVAGISASYSSSCRTLSENSSSYTVEALGKPDCSLSSLRFTLGRESTKSDMDTLVTTLQKIMK